ncbi:Hypothetical protein CINCED_3A014571 [Cinara cedri]|nr:Hypothetical protein CINCED_3A014571 [Cinara cedri]
MADNRIDSPNSALKIPLIVRPQPSQPRSQPESLLLNDILEEKTLDLRNTLTEFLLVEPYSKFNIEFNKFLTHTKRIIQESRQTSSNVTRFNDLSQISQTSNNPPSSFYRPQSTASTISSNNNNTSAFKIPEMNYLKKKILPTKLSYLQPRIILSRCDDIAPNSNKTPTLCNTIIEKNQKDSNTGENKNTNQLASTSKTSDSSKTSAVCKTFNEDNQNNCKTIPRNNNAIQLGVNQPKVSENVEKYLSMWSIHVTPNKLNTTFLVNITGSLLSGDQVTVAEKTHNAGILEYTKENNLIKTTNGLYRLIGSIIGGSPNELYSACVEINGIPTTWKSIIKKMSKVNKSKLLNLTLKSPAELIMSTKTEVNLDKSITRSGKEYNTMYINNESIKNHSNQDVTENKNKRRKLHEPTGSLHTSTPKKLENRLKIVDNTSHLLKSKFHKKIQTKTNEILNKQTRIDSVNDSIIVTKKRQSIKNNKYNY